VEWCGAESCEEEEGRCDFALNTERIRAVAVSAREVAWSKPGVAAVPWAWRRRRTLPCARWGFSLVGLGPDGLRPVRRGAGPHSEGGRPV
jgi:hypothetical protein